MRTKTRGFLYLFVVLFASLALAGCGDSPSASVASTPTPPPFSSNSGIARPVLASSEILTGPDRLVFGLVDSESGNPISDIPSVTIQFFKVNADGSATKTGDATPLYRSENLPVGVYVVQTNFTEAGSWGLLMDINRDGQEPYQVKSDFEVISDSALPMRGEAVPHSLNDTLQSVGDITLICSAVPEDNMHSMTISDAVQSGKPTVVLFAAPGYCPSFTCGPDLELVQTLKSKYGDKINFIHIESPNSIQNHTHTGTVSAEHRQEEGHQGVLRPQVATAEEWGLKTEPWLFVVDKDGKLTSRFEGGLTIDEVEPAVAALAK
jgi:hypothetical protein